MGQSKQVPHLVREVVVHGVAEHDEHEHRRPRPSHVALGIGVTGERCENLNTCELKCEQPGAKDEICRRIVPPAPQANAGVSAGDKHDPYVLP